MRKLSCSVISVFVLSVAACGGGSGSSSTPSTPTTPTQANRSPVINSVNVTPSFGISELTSFNYIASANDADGDNLTYAWDLAGNAASGTSGSITFKGSGTGTFKVTVTDGKGGSATDSRTITVGSMTGNWSFFVPGQGTLLLSLTQNNTFVSGNFVVAPGGFGNVGAGSTGRTDPAQPGSIDGNGRVVIRLKVGVFIDFTMTGNMDTTGQRVTGALNGSGFSGQAFTMTKQ